MTRIRTIKPAFWTDEKVGKLSWGARLLFIATWNLADDEGILVWNASYLKGQVFTYDSHVSLAKIKGFMQELIDKNFVEKYDVGDDVYAFVTHFSLHQVINKPMASTKPLPTSVNFVPKYTFNSRNGTGIIQEHSSGEWKGIRNGMEGNKERTMENQKSYFPEWLKIEMWEAFLEMRRVKKAYPTEKAKELILNDLEKLKAAGEDPNAIMEQSIKNNWTGVFALNKSQTGGNHNGYKASSRYSED